MRRGRRRRLRGGGSFEAAGPRQRTRVRLAVKALHESHRAFSASNDVADPDATWWKGECKTAVTSTGRVEVAEVLEFVDDLHHVMTGDAKRRGDVGREGIASLDAMPQDEYAGARSR